MSFTNLIPEMRRKQNKQLHELKGEIESLRLDREYHEEKIDEIDRQIEELEEQIEPEIEWLKDEKRRLDQYCGFPGIDCG